ncbi:MAG: hypothetical protein RR150_00090 [Clostridia bacterium]
MRSFDEVLLEHNARYPLWAARDRLKLLYQSCFGAGHMISDQASCLKRLQDEYAALPALGAPDDVPPIEEIAGGLCRVHLRAIPPAQVQALGALFIQGARLIQPDLPAFDAGLRLLSAESAALAREVARYRAAGCPAVSHSQGYRAAYHPAYRVVPKELLPQNFALQGRAESV